MIDFYSEKRCKYLLILILVVVSGFKLAFTVMSPVSLFSEETQYWLWSKHLDWNYYSKPLMIAVYNKIGTMFFGDTEIAVRFSAWIFTGLAAVLVFKLFLYMFGKPFYALMAAVMVLVMPFFHLASVFHTTDSSLVFFWVFTMYLAWKAIQESKTRYWIYAGLATFGGILSKNVMVLILPLIFLYLLITQPKLLLKRDFYLFSLVSSLSIIPIVMWNFKNDFVTFRHLGTLGGIIGIGGFDWTAALRFSGEYLGGQMAVISLFFLPLLILSFIRWAAYWEKELLFLLMPAILIWLMFIGVSLVKRVEVNWPAFSYVTLPIAMAYAVSVNERWKRYTYMAIGISGLLLAGIMYPAPLDAIGFKKVLKPQKDPFFRMAGYRELGERVDFLLDSLEIGNHFVFSDSYHIAAELAFYMQGNPQTFNPNLGRRKNQFDLWPRLDQFENLDYAGVFVKRGKEDNELVNGAFQNLLYEELNYGILRGEKVLTFKIQFFEAFKRLEELKSDAY
ncbi:ArnT family glycosyltransferase [Lunatibacter salilacus]|uniref:ArnT family glycosyltransferase n=1 Tax=Lunatibacter salilacus TaxID=2483804 RepID=UPI00131DCAC5|nr:glycosyltransferase family 39 protein [Lunatibacter salilacus]